MANQYLSFMKSLLIVLGLCPLLTTCQPVPDSSLMGRTTGQLPHLLYGLGEDRLGGAKMSFLDTNVLIKVVDSIKDDYKVALSKNHFAYMPKANFKKDDTIQIQ